MEKPVWPEEGVFHHLLALSIKEHRFTVASLQVLDETLPPETVESDPVVRQVAAEDADMRRWADLYIAGKHREVEKLAEVSGKSPWLLAKVLAKRGFVAVPMSSPQAIPQFEMVSVKSAIKIYLGEQRARLGQIGDKGLKQGSFNAKRKHILCALGLSCDEREVRISPCPLDLERPIQSLQYEDYASLAKYLASKESGVRSTRTAKNYSGDFLSMLRWFSEQPKYGFSFPPSIGKLFEFGKPRSAIAKYDSAMLKGLLAVAAPRTQLFILLGLNGGLYPQDISDLTHDCLIRHRDTPCLWWYRSKESGADGGRFRVLTPLWPEAHKLLLEHLAPKDHPSRRLFLNRSGVVLVKPTKGGNRTDNVGQAFGDAWNQYLKTLKEPPAQEITFRQLRKIGRWLVRRCGNRLLGKLWSGQVIEGVDFSYDEIEPDDYNDLFPVLQKVRDRLIEDEVLPLPQRADGVATSDQK